MKSSDIPIRAFKIGPVHKKDVTICSTMVEKAKDLACILAFDVKMDSDARDLAEDYGIKVFEGVLSMKRPFSFLIVRAAKIIYHLFDAVMAYQKEITEAKQADATLQAKAVWPCRSKILRAFATRDPIILGVEILDGSLRVGTPLCVIKKNPETQKKEVVDLGEM